MKKTLCTFFVFVCLFTKLFAQTEKERADILIMMDTSGTILPYYDDINKRVLNEINSKFIREGDMVHLISFNSSARHEISQEIKSESDLSRIVSRFMLLYQLGQHSDLLTAFDYGKTFTQNLKTQGTEKILIIISDGIFNPPAQSPYASYNAEQLKNKISNVSNDIRNDGWKVYFVKLPFPDNVLIHDLNGNLIDDIASTADPSRTLANGTSGIGSTGATGDALGNTPSRSNTDDWTSTANEQAANNGGVNGTSGTGGSTGSSTNSSGYTDISGDVTNSMGITPSTYSSDPNNPFQFNEDTATLPRVQFPDSLTSSGRKLAVPLKITNPSDEDISLNLEQLVITNGSTNYTAPVRNGSLTIPAGETVELNGEATLPSEVANGTYNSDVRLQFADNKAVLPQVATLPVHVKPTFIEELYQSGKLWIILAIAAVVLLLLLLLLFFLLRGRTRNPLSNALRDVSGHDSLNAFSAQSSSDARRNAQTADEYANQIAAARRAEAEARSALLNSSSGNTTYPSAQYSEQRIKAHRNQSGMTEIYVFNQNRSIGKRNIHIMKPGSQRSVGGGKGDDFLIFLVRFPSNLASVRYDGQDYHLTINKREYFPYVQSNTVNNCIGKTITVVSDKGYHVGFTFREYEDPISNLNNILTSIKYD
ncbi:MAG: VWA domain-containing protein [Spirochaetaceae bacterium]|nr:VWA domain-containing protein [Spirochaetaceae bacterium]